MINREDLQKEILERWYDSAPKANYPHAAAKRRGQAASVAVKRFKNRRRDADIAARRARGESWRSIAKVHDMSHMGVRKIALREEREGLYAPWLL